MLMQRLREELKEIALAQCKDTVAEFAKCAKESGMMVVFSCKKPLEHSKYQFAVKLGHLREARTSMVVIALTSFCFVPQHGG